jgi:hypothetical protein
MFDCSSANTFGGSFIRRATRVPGQVQEVLKALKDNGPEPTDEEVEQALGKIEPQISSE